MGPIRVEGAENVPRQGGLLILSNHRADVDPVLVQYACPRPLHYMAKQELFEMGMLGPLIRRYGAFPVSRGEPDRQAIRQAAGLLNAGEAVVVFPEGQLTQTGDLQELKAGIALILRLAPEVPVICIGLQNSQYMLPYGQLIPRPAFRRLTLMWGKPRVFSTDASHAAVLGWTECELRRLGGYGQ
jgi:1-acyl-sn-glycerol-3-phosphate acyltransferase